MKIKSFVKEECVQATTMKETKSRARAAEIKTKHLLALVLPPSLSPPLCLTGLGYCIRSIPVLRPKRLKHHTLWGGTYLYG